MFFPLRYLLFGLSGSLLILLLDGVLAQAPGFAAESVSVRYGPFARSLPVADLKAYAQTQTVSPKLRSFLKSISTEDQKAIQSGLQTQIPLNVVTMDRLLRSDYGQKALSEIKPVIKRDDDAALPALRAALTLGAASPGGFGVISFLEAYPSQTIQINLPQAVQFVRKNEQ
ncbi:MAG TPA: alpha/beta hydrolase, partial [Candidatus Caenarcaniphilales bacterium]